MVPQSCTPVRLANKTTDVAPAGWGAGAVELPPFLVREQKKSWGRLRPFWARLGPSWGLLGCVLGAPWGVLGGARGLLMLVLSQIRANRGAYTKN